MCGISVIVSNKHNEDELKKYIHLMNERIIHRGPDAEGIFCKKNIALGHRRLSIIDLSSSANQPLFYDKYILVFNGEIYNYIELKKELQEKGYIFNTSSDSEIIPAAYDYWGKDCLHKFNGMWAFALYNLSDNTLFLSRDRYGIKPLYYYQNQGVINFFSEIKQILDLPWFDKQMNLPVINEFIKGNYNCTTDTFFKSVHEIRGGHAATIDLNNQNFKIYQWYDVKSYIKPQKLNYQEILDDTYELMIDSLKLRLRADVNVGACLSGGLDSSTIVSLVKTNQLANNDFKTITTTYHIKEFDETYYSDLLCKKLGVNNIKVYPKLENYYKENILLKINYHQDQPIPGCSHINEYEVFKKAREENIIVMLDGQGADEYLLGYPEFENQYIIDLFKNKNYIKAIQLLRIVSSNRNSSLLKEFKKVLYLIKNNNKYQLGYQNSVENLSLTELLITSIPYQLHSEDRNSMLNSIESRLPFLDYRLVEFILSVDVAHKLHKGQRKSILRDFNPHLPDAIKNRKDKMGFVAPDDIFLQSIPKNKMDEMKSAIQSFAINVDDLNMTRTKFKLVSLYYWMKAFEFVD